MLERARKTFRLKVNERCPGEVLCTTDPVEGVVSKLAGETLETYCNKERCKFYYTKDGSTPLEFFGMFEAAMILREARLGELRRQFEWYEQTLPGWAIEAYKAAERAFRQAENEINSETPEEREAGGAQNVTRFIDGGDSDAFAKIEQAILTAQAEAAAGNDWELVLSRNPHLTEEIFSYMRETTVPRLTD